MTAGSTAHLPFDVRQIPFSRRGAWFGLSPVTAPHTVSGDLHLVAHQRRMTPVLRLVPLDGPARPDGTSRPDGTPRPDGTAVTATPSLLRWSAAGGHVEAVFEGVETLRLRGDGLALRLCDGVPPAPFTGSHFFRDPVDGSYVFASEDTGLRYRVTAVTGPVAAGRDGHEGLVVGGDGPWEAAVQELGTALPPYRAERPFDEVERAVAAEFAAYADAVAPWRTERTPAAEQAAYVLWSATVRPSGFLTRETVLMSKHWMDKVWSWDHCFNALALAPGLPQAALDQFSVVFDHQDPSGALPDLVGHSTVAYTYVKPPVHGWAFARLRALLPPLGREQLTEVYERLARLTGFWLTSRRAPGHPLPHYQHGNDSGWDNSTLFDGGGSIEAPDLAALLVVQLDVLAGLADELGDGRTGHWRAERRELTAALTGLWDGRTFTARRAADGAPRSARSLLLLMPVVAAGTLDPAVAARLADAVAAHLTPHGLATEPPDSPAYESDGYWRGPVWGPPTVLAVDGLRRAGFPGPAERISAAFRRLCERSGFAENFDALTGEALRDRAYTWTASCYLLLAREFTEREAGT
jgi:hypothetical protein